jgi:hypothetical protein
MTSSWNKDTHLVGCSLQRDVQWFPSHLDFYVKVKWATLSAFQLQWASKCLDDAVLMFLDIVCPRLFLILFWNC